MNKNPNSKETHDERINCIRLGNEKKTESCSTSEQTSTSSEENDQTTISTSTRNWQGSKTTIKERIAFMFNNEILADVHFVVGKGTQSQRIPAHKFVLSVGSVVFDAMFNGPLAVKNDEIELPDIEPPAFFALLRFLYSDSVKIDPETVMTTLYTAKKYAVPALEKHCVEFLQHNLSSDNAFMLLSQARLFDEPKLEAMCLKTIDTNAYESLSADGFTDVDLDTLCSVLIRDTLKIKEAKLFQAVVRWSKAECQRTGVKVGSENQRIVLGNALKLIRFPLMSINEFASQVVQSGILTPDEALSVFMYYTLAPKPKIEFSDKPRASISTNGICVNRFQQVEMKWGYSGTCDRIRFTVDHPVYLIGYGLYGSAKDPAEYKAFIEVIQTSTNKVLASNDTKFHSNGTMAMFKVMFEEPVQISPNISYTASATIRGQDSFFGTKGLRKVSVDTTVGRVTFQFSYSSGNNNGSTVEDGQIPQLWFVV